MNDDKKLCPYCGEEILQRAILCKHCKSRLDHPAEFAIKGAFQSAFRKNFRTYLGLTGAFVLAAGTFCPLVTLPLLGSVNYFASGKGDGVFLLLLAALSVYFALKRKFKYLWYAGLLSASLLVFTIINFNLTLSGVSSKLEGQKNMFSGLADLAVASISISWGFFVLTLGSVVLIAAALMRERVVN